MFCQSALSSHKKNLSIPDTQVPKPQTTKARASNLTLPHGLVPLPVFMPVATQASLKGLTSTQLAQTGCKLCLNNTYHLGLKPGQEVLEKIGGAHAFQGWNGNILTDSGGWVANPSPSRPPSNQLLFFCFRKTKGGLTLSNQKRKKFPNGKPAQTIHHHRSRGPLPLPTRRLPHAADAGTLHLLTKHNRQRHHDAARRRRGHDLAGHGADARSHGTVRPLAGPLHRRAPEPWKPEPVLHHPGWTGSGVAAALLRGDGEARHAWCRDRRAERRRGEG